jgi:hypothetical protein
MSSFDCYSKPNPDHLVELAETRAGYLPMRLSRDVRSLARACASFRAMA